VAVFVPLLVAMVSIVISYRAFTATAELQRQQAKDQFDMPAAQLVVNNTDPELAHYKAQLLQELFPHQFPQNWAENFRQERYCLPAFDDRMTFAKLAIEHSDQRKALSSLWLQMYCQQERTPFSEWLKAGPERFPKQRESH
jgi:hypothetical protein